MWVYTRYLYDSLIYVITLVHLKNKIIYKTVDVFAWKNVMYLTVCSIINTLVIFLKSQYISKQYQPGHTFQNVRWLKETNFKVPNAWYSK